MPRIDQPQSAEPRIAIAYALCVLLGVFGAHRFYLRERGTAVALLLVTLASLALMVIAIGFFTIWISVAWAIVDLFRIPKLARQGGAAGGVPQPGT